MSDALEDKGLPQFRLGMENPLSVITRAESVDTILQVCLKVTGMGYGVVAHVTDDRWLACAVRDQIGFNLPLAPPISWAMRWPMAIRNRIAAAHNGDLTASSIPGETCFEFRMPFAE